MGHIYLVTNKINGKQYVGQTVRPIKDRWSAHVYDATHHTDNSHLHNAMAKYGIDAFEVSEIECIPDELLSGREMFWIDKLDTYNTGYNCTLGGEGRVELDRDLICRLWRSGLPISQIAITANCSIAGARIVLGDMSLYSAEESEQRSRAFYRKKANQYDLDGNFIAYYDSLRGAAEAVGGSESVIHTACCGSAQTAYGFQWRYAGDGPPGKYVHPYKKQVVQYDLDGNYITTHLSIDEAARNASSNHKSILECCTHDKQMAGGYQWRYVGDTPPGKYIDGRKTPVAQYDLGGNLVAIHPSLREAGESISTKYYGISDCCRHLKQIYGGYQWRYVTDEPPSVYVEKAG